MQTIFDSSSSKLNAIAQEFTLAEEYVSYVTKLRPRLCIYSCTVALAGAALSHFRLIIWSCNAYSPSRNFPYYSSFRLQKSNTYSTNTKSLAWSGSKSSYITCTRYSCVFLRIKRWPSDQPWVLRAVWKRPWGGRWAVIGKCSRAGSPRTSQTITACVVSNDTSWSHRLLKNIYMNSSCRSLFIEGAYLKKDSQYMIWNKDKIHAQLNNKEYVFQKRSTYMETDNFSASIVQ